jgi:hypothetical protein
MSWVLCGIFFSIPAAILAKMELGKIDRGESSAAGRGLAQAAFWIAVVNVVLTVVGVCAYFVIMAGVFGLAAAGQAG